MSRLRPLYRASLSIAALLSAMPFAVAAAEERKPTAQFVTLGTGGGPVMRLKRSQPANAVVVNGAVYLFDAGDGVERQMLVAGLRLPQLRAVFISHHHIDHSGGLASLLVDRWVLGSFAPLPLFGPAGTIAFAKGVGEGYVGTEYATASIGKPRPSIASSITAQDLAAEIPSPTLIYSDENIRVLAVANTHYHYPVGSEAARNAHSYSYRIEAGSRSFVFTGDTGRSDAVTALAKGADILVSEVMDADMIRTSLSRQPDLTPEAASTMVANMSRDHLLPADVGELARKAGVKAVVLTHLVPGRDDDAAPDRYGDGVRAVFKGPVTVAKDLDRF